MVSTAFQARGYTDDQQAYDGLLVDWMEWVPDLQWPTSVQTYHMMRADPQIKAVLEAIGLPIRRALKALDPAGCRPEVVQHCADNLGLPILEKDDEPGPARRKGFRFDDHLRLALLRDVYGHYGFELEAENRDGRTWLTGAYERLPHTIRAINTEDRTGELVSVEQHGKGSAGGNQAPIPREHLAWYVREREGSAWQGRSLLRPAYGPWLLKHEMWRVHATANRRNGAGIPVAEALPGTTPSPDQIADAAKLAQQAKVGDQGGAAAPPGFALRFKGVEGGTVDTVAFIRYLDQQISRMALAGMLDLGETPNGSRALGAEFVDLFLLSIQAEAEEIAYTFTQDVVARIVEWNWGPDEEVPCLVIGDVGSDRQVTAESLQMLISSGAITGDPALEAYVRREWHLPERDEPPTPPPAATPPAPGEAPPQSLDGMPPEMRQQAQRVQQVAAAQGEVKLRRQPTALEAASGVDHVRIQRQWADRLDELLATWGGVTEGQRAALRAAIDRAEEDGDQTALLDIQVPAGAAEDALLAAMVQAAEDAAAQARADMIKVGRVPPRTAGPDRDELGRTAQTVAGMLAGGMVAFAGREALRRWGTGNLGAQVDEAVTGLTGRALRDNLGYALTAAQRAGRYAVLDKADTEGFVASEVLDANACEACVAVDGTQYPTLEAAAADYPAGGYVDCEAGLRCRGVVMPVWE